MSIIDSSRLDKKVTNSVFAISNAANKAKAKDNKVINATVGMFFGEDQKFKTFDCVNTVAKNITGVDAYSYIMTSGGALYNESVQSWVLGTNFEYLKKKLFVSSIATPGGTGAITLSLMNYLHAGETVLLPFPRWSAYDNICKERGLKIENYSLYNANNVFDFEEFKSKCEKIVNEEHKLYCIINDPCHNPTGFCLREEDYTAIVNLANEIGKYYPVILLFDVAYIDYSEKRGQVVRSYYKKFATINNNVMIQFVFSASKSFGLYGLRVGALIALTKEESEIGYFTNACEVACRSTWSNCSHLGIEIVNRLINDSRYKNCFNQELTIACNELHQRAVSFLEASKKYEIKTSCYSYGFFINIKVDNPNDIYEKLVRLGVYVLPLKDSIRIALSSIANEDCDRLASLIARAVHE